MIDWRGYQRDIWQRVRKIMVEENMMTNGYVSIETMAACKENKN
jgi:hypothetical protein